MRKNHRIRRTMCLLAALFAFLGILVFFGRCSKNPSKSDESDTVTDIDGNVYQTVRIGDQLWMAENLRVTHYRNGDAIPNVTGNTAWSGLASGAYCEYDNDEDNAEVYGFLYNWYAVKDNRNIAPEGWHVPTDDEWKQLEVSLGMSQSDADKNGGIRGTNEGGKLKEAGFAHWVSPNEGATNESGFTALPGGYRDTLGSFYSMGYWTYFWSSTQYDLAEVYARSLYYGTPIIYRGSEIKGYAQSVRCVKDH